MLDLKWIFDPDRAAPNPAVVLDAIPVVPDTTPEDLPPDWHFLWDERAAIMEYDGKMPKEHAEAEALKDILARMQREGVELPKRYLH
jgi:hypothetical protein